jgi:hypothetical protein
MMLSVLICRAGPVSCVHRWCRCQSIEPCRPTDDPRDLDGAVAMSPR